MKTMISKNSFTGPDIFVVPPISVATTSPPPIFPNGTPSLEKIFTPRVEWRIAVHISYGSNPPAVWQMSVRGVAENDFLTLIKYR